MTANYIEERGTFLAAAIRNKVGDRVLAGPFKGLKLNLDRFSGNYAPYLLGTYEQELQWTLLDLITRSKNYKNIINVGCSFGYYACGLAKLLPSSMMLAHDIDPNAIELCMDTAYINNLQNVAVSVDRPQLSSANLIVMDCEGAEEEYLDPAAVDFSKKDVLVELHECNKLGLAQSIIDRFKDTHDIKIIYNEAHYTNLKTIFGDDIELQHFDNAIATYEGRAGATPWAWMTCK